MARFKIAIFHCHEGNGWLFVPCFLTQLGKGSNDFYHFEQILCPVLVHAMMVAVFFIIFQVSGDAGNVRKRLSRLYRVGWEGSCLRNPKGRLCWNDWCLTLICRFVTFGHGIHHHFFGFFCCFWLLSSRFNLHWKDILRNTYLFFSIFVITGSSLREPDSATQISFQRVSTCFHSFAVMPLICHVGHVAQVRHSKWLQRKDRIHTYIYIFIYPYPSMYGVLPTFGWFFVVNVRTHTIHAMGYIGRSLSRMNRLGMNTNPIFCHCFISAPAYIFKASMRISGNQSAAGCFYFLIFF